MISSRNSALGFDWGRRVFWCCALLIGGAACGGRSLRSGDNSSVTLNAGNGGASSTDDSSLAGASGEPSDACSPGLEGLVDVSVTPRADVNLELLALKFSPQFVADQAVYERLVRDVSAIQTADPRMADVGYFAPNDGRSLFISVDANTLARMRAGAYHDWDCLNQELIATDFEYEDAPQFPHMGLTLKGIYNLDTVGAQYAQLNGVSRVEQGGIGGGGGSTICVTQEGATWHYVFDHASGDCPSGCIDHSYAHFTTDARGAVTSLGAPNEAARVAYANAEACR